MATFGLQPRAPGAHDLEQRLRRRAVDAVEGRRGGREAATAGAPAGSRGVERRDEGRHAVGCRVCSGMVALPSKSARLGLVAQWAAQRLLTAKLPQGMPVWSWRMSL